MDSRYDSMENFMVLTQDSGISGTVRDASNRSTCSGILDEQAYRYNNRKDATDFDLIQNRSSLADRRSSSLTWKQVVGLQ